MVAFRPTRALEGPRAPAVEERRKQQSDEADTVKDRHGHVATDVDGVGEEAMIRGDFGFDAEVIVSGGDTGDDDGIVLAAFVPRAVAIVAVVVADFAAEVPSLLGIG